MTHWMCTTCGYYLQGSAPPDRCPSCQQACAFNDVTCYRPECGGELNIDPLLVGGTLGIIKGVPQTAGKPKPSPEPIPPSSEAIPRVEILRGLSEQQRQQLKSLGNIERYEPNAVIFTEGAEAWKFYLVEEGQVAVERQLARGMRFPISIVSPGQAFGWSGLVQPYLYTATVAAVSRTRVLAIERDGVLAMMRANPSLGFKMMENVASVVASRLRNLELAMVGLVGR